MAKAKDQFYTAQDVCNLLGEKKWTQADLARKTGIRPNTISELYHELVDRVNLEQLDKICEVLECELNDLIIRVDDATTVKQCGTNNSSNQ